MGNRLVGAFLLKRFSRTTHRSAADGIGPAGVPEIWLEHFAIIAIPGTCFLDLLLWRAEKRFFIFKILLPHPPGWWPHRPLGAQVRLAGLFLRHGIRSLGVHDRVFAVGGDLGIGVPAAAANRAILESSEELGNLHLFGLFLLYSFRLCINLALLRGLSRRLALVLDRVPSRHLLLTLFAQSLGTLNLLLLLPRPLGGGGRLAPVVRGGPVHL